MKPPRDGFVAALFGTSIGGLVILFFLLNGSLKVRPFHAEPAVMAPVKRWKPQPKPEAPGSLTFITDTELSDTQDMITSTTRYTFVPPRPSAARGSCTCTCRCCESKAATEKSGDLYFVGPDTIDQMPDELKDWIIKYGERKLYESDPLPINDPDIPAHAAEPPVIDLNAVGGVEDDIEIDAGGGTVLDSPTNFIADDWDEDATIIRLIQVNMKIAP